MKMLSEGIHHLGDGLLEVSEERLKDLIVHEDINELYEVEQTPFARGKFAAVRRAINKKTGVSFAAKFLRRRRRAQCWAKDIGHEIAVLMLCADSKHIVKLHSVHETKTETALLLELATGGELQAILDDEGELSEAQVRTCMRQILLALEFMHKKSIAHLDLKPQNILMCGEKVEDGLKLCDFGISRVVEEGGKIREILGTPDYVAPEVLQYEPLSLKTDIWSIGVLSYVLLTGCSPFGGDNKQETFLNISKCSLTFPDELFENVSPVAIDFIKSALRIKPNERMSVEECLEHRWLLEDSVARPLPLETVPVEDQTEEEVTVALTQETTDVKELELQSLDSISTSTSSLSPTSSPGTTENVVSLKNPHNHHQFHLNHSSSGLADIEHEVFFPDAPTTPKVSRKAPPDTPPSVKALVKKFQLEQAQLSDGEIVIPPTISPSSTFVSQIPKLITSPLRASSFTKRSLLGLPTTPIKSSSSYENEQSLVGFGNFSPKSLVNSKDSPTRCTKFLRCLVCGDLPGCHHQKSVIRKAIGMEQRITC